MSVYQEIDSYKKINVILIFIIMFIFFYCFFLPYLNFGLRSSCEGLPLAYCKSRGLTRAFSQILRFHFQEAIAYNPFSIKIFCFFFLQLIARFLINMIISFSLFRKILIFDVSISVISFLFSFYNLVLPY
ncbi:hypothetical protein BB050_00252 [Flavobacterium anhuiense]|uniref:Uncharacterized protein n=2 Tax=Flavobacterium anhuiense TaxID=459526 RepID=A0AAC9GGL8_9FLAO|nr:hypothetical protein BB050_00252 [Flavobacterium anhuiense]